MKLNIFFAGEKIGKAKLKLSHRNYFFHFQGHHFNSVKELAQHLAIPPDDLIDALVFSKQKTKRKRCLNRSKKT